MADQLTTIGMLMLDGMVVGTTAFAWCVYATVALCVLVGERTGEPVRSDAQANYNRDELLFALIAWWVVLPWKAWQRTNRETGQE